MKKDFKGLLESKGYIKDTIEDSKNSKFKITFKLRNDYEIPLIIIFDEYFPAKLPYIRIDGTRFHIPQKPHILSEGYICYLDKEGVLWNSDPSIVLDLVFERVEKILLDNNDLVEYHKEFNYYFATLSDLEQAVSLYQQNGFIEELSLYTIKRDEPLVFLKGDEESKKTLENLVGQKISSLQKKALFISLDKPYQGPVPQEDTFWSADEISDLVKNHIKLNKLEKLKKIVTNKRNYYYLLEIPLMTGLKVTIGLWYRRIKKSRSIKSNPIISSDPQEEFKIHPIYIHRYDDQSLIERGGGIDSDSKILIVGCGSVGSDLLFLLARSGLKNFTIVDYDKLNMENSYRHFLGMNKAVKRDKKVDLLKEELENRYPSIRITALDIDILVLIKEGILNFNDYRLVIFAIGEPNVERLLNKLILETETPAIFTWVEAYGLGGHALLVNNSDKGCYECLVDDQLINYASFAGKSDKPYTKNINGCSGTFTPYGGVDSMHTALIASQLALKVINNEIKDNPLVSWKGSSEEFRNNGYETSPRYEKSLDNLNKENTGYIQSNCKCCSEEKIKDDN